MRHAQKKIPLNQASLISKKRRIKAEDMKERKRNILRTFAAMKRGEAPGKGKLLPFYRYLHKQSFAEAAKALVEAYYGPKDIDTHLCRAIRAYLREAWKKPVEDFKEAKHGKAFLVWLAINILNFHRMYQQQGHPS